MMLFMMVHADDDDDEDDADDGNPATMFTHRWNKINNNADDHTLQKS